MSKRGGTSPREVAKFVSTRGTTIKDDAETDAYSSGEEDNTPKSTLHVRKRANSVVRARTEYVTNIISKAPQARGATITSRIDASSGRASVIVHNPDQVTDGFIEKLKQMMPWAAVRVDVKANENYKDPTTGGIARGPALHVSFDISKVIERDMRANGYAFNLGLAVVSLIASLLLLYWLYSTVAPYW